MYANYCRAFGARVMVFDPYKSVSDAGLEKTKVDAVFSESDVIALRTLQMKRIK